MSVQKGLMPRYSFEIKHSQIYLSVHKQTDQCLMQPTATTNIIFKSAWEHLVLNPALPCCEACKKNLHYRQTLSLTCATLAGLLKQQQLALNLENQDVEKLQEKEGVTRKIVSIYICEKTHDLMYKFYQQLKMFISLRKATLKS